MVGICITTHLRIPTTVVAHSTQDTQTIVAALAMALARIRQGTLFHRAIHPQ